MQIILKAFYFSLTIFLKTTINTSSFLSLAWLFDRVLFPQKTKKNDTFPETHKQLQKMCCPYFKTCVVTSRTGARLHQIELTHHEWFFATCWKNPFDNNLTAIVSAHVYACICTCTSQSNLFDRRLNEQFRHKNDILNS